MLECVTLNWSRRTGREILILQRLLDNIGHKVTRHSFGIQKRHEEHCARSRENGKVYGSDDRFGFYVVSTYESRKL